MPHQDLSDDAGASIASADRRCQHNCEGFPMSRVGIEREGGITGRDQFEVRRHLVRRDREGIEVREQMS
ncbi:MAG: hypothetical protein M5U18_04545 [Dehalococcoidia bacterium]|nr:hypothetical protein [Dehalococcoidia bacterium]